MGNSTVENIENIENKEISPKEIREMLGIDNSQIQQLCKIADIKKHYLNDIDYYILVPINDNSLKLNIPVTNTSIRGLLKKDEVNAIIDNIINVKVLETDEKNIEAEYKKLLQSGRHEDWIKIIDIDRNYFDMAEKYLYTEFSVVLDMSFDETKEYIINKMTEVQANE